MKTQLLKICIAVLAVAGLVACNGNGVDQRDAFTGNYTFVATGTFDIYAGASKLVSLPLNQEGSFTITKEGEKDQVNIIGYNDTIHAKVNGNTLTLEANEYTTTINNIELRLNFNYGKATLVNNVLTWQSDVTGTGKYNSITASGNGTVTVVGTKKTESNE